MNAVGEEVLDAAKEALHDQIEKDPAATGDQESPQNSPIPEKITDILNEITDTPVQLPPVEEQAKKLNIDDLINRAKEEIEQEESENP